MKNYFDMGDPIGEVSQRAFLSINHEVAICDQCEAMVPYNQSHKLKDSIFLCSDCLSHYNALTDKMVKKSINSYLDGNVL